MAFKKAVTLSAVYEPGPQAKASPSRFSKPSFESKPILLKAYPSQAFLFDHEFE